MIDILSLRSFLTVILVLFPAFLGAATLPSLNEEEQKLVSQGEVIVREVPTDAQAGRTFEAIGLIDASRASVVRVLTDYALRKGIPIVPWSTSPSGRLKPSLENIPRPISQSRSEGGNMANTELMENYWSQAAKTDALQETTKRQQAGAEKSLKKQAELLLRWEKVIERWERLPEK